MSARLTLSMQLEGVSRGRHVRDVIHELARLHGVRGALVVAPDGFVIAAHLPPMVPVDPLAALAATLGRDLEVNAARVGRPAFQTAIFAADDGSVVLGSCPIGFVVLLAEPQAGLSLARAALREAVSLLRTAWTGETDTGPADA